MRGPYATTCYTPPATIATGAASGATTYQARLFRVDARERESENRIQKRMPNRMLLRVESSCIVAVVVVHCSLGLDELFFGWGVFYSREAVNSPVLGW